MHGRAQRNSESCRILRRSSSCRHMQPVSPSAGTNRSVVAVGDHSCIISLSNDGESFFKDGRKISIGDCALFRPPQDSPPFIGIIRWLSPNKETTLQLGVNWLYRPSELKLQKGSQLDAAPNEIFYSFHKDEIAVASLLHPCKVAFLPKGAELPGGISSFVCRRVYDIKKKCLCWLTDQDYIDDRQEEVDQLLRKTQIEMHGMQSGGRSPKPANGPTSMLQSRSGSDNGQSFSSHVKGKKRERGDQGNDPVKRERLSKTDGDSGHCKSDNNLKSEIEKITEKGGLMELEGVEKLVQLMRPDRNERKMDLISRAMLAGVLAATEKFDCLNRFVHLRGLLILDEWLQDIHKGSIGDGHSSKNGDKPVEEFLLALLHALEKLPVNLQALQMCNIGRSVNHLRSHKNLEIQRKARSLVDMWKKHVKAEMNSIDAKSGSGQSVSSWPSKSRLQEGGGRNSSGSDVAIKNSVTQASAIKSISAKASHGESNNKSSHSSPGRRKSSPPESGKDRDPVDGTSDLSASRDEKSSISTHAYNRGHSSSPREDGKVSTPRSGGVSKISIGGSRTRKSLNGFPGTSVTGAQRETSSNRGSSLHRNAVMERSVQPGLDSEKLPEVPLAEGGTHKLIVKIPNRVQSPAQVLSVGSLEKEDPSSVIHRTSPVHSDKNDKVNRCTKDRDEPYQPNVVRDVSTESKDVLTGSDEGDGSPTAQPDEEGGRTSVDPRKTAEGSQGNELKPGKLRQPSFSPMNALIESCAKYSEANSSMSLDDDVGMNLLASVATGEISRSDLVSSTDSPERSTQAVDEACTGDEAKSKLSHETGDVDDRKQVCAANLLPGDGSRPSINMPSRNSEDTSAGESSRDLKPDSLDLRTVREPQLDTSEKCTEMTVSSSLSPLRAVEKVVDHELVNYLSDEKSVSSNVNGDSVLKCIAGGDVLTNEDGGSPDHLRPEEGKRITETVSSNEQFDDVPRKEPCNDSNNKEPCDVATKDAQKDDLSSGHLADEKKLIMSAEKSDDEKLENVVSSQKLISENGEVKVDGATEKNVEQSTERQSFEKEVDRTLVEDQGRVGVCSTPNDVKIENVKTTEELPENSSNVMQHRKESPAISSQEGEEKGELRETKLRTVTEEETQECGASQAAVAAAASVSDAKVKFDLNEGFITDDGKFGEPVNFITPPATTVHMTNLSPFAVNSVSSSLPASITVAAAAKGPFVPPDDLLRSKGELGWKGSAATSAFRPAEPRKVLETSSGSMNVSSSDASVTKHSRPLLDFDLNVADEGALEDMASRDCDLAVGSTSDHTNNHDSSQNERKVDASARGSGLLNLDLNRVDEVNDVDQSNHKPEASVPFKRFGNVCPGDVRRDFDLNDGPKGDDAAVEHLSFQQSSKGTMPQQLPPGGFRINSPDLGNFSSWWNTYSTVPIPSMLPDRADQTFPIVPPGAQPQRVLGPPTGTTFAPDVYRGSVLSSSPAVPFQSSPFQYPMFPFGTTFPLSSATFSVGATSYIDSSSSGRVFVPPVNSQLLGPAGTVSTQFPRPYVVNLSEGSSNGRLENNRTWSRKGLDLNAGPGAGDVEGREDMLPSASRQLSVASSQVMSEEQARMYSASGGILKRKEPEGGWDAESLRHRQSSWQ